MVHKQPTDEIRAVAALYSLGALPEPEAREFEEHLSGGCQVCRQELAAFEAAAAGLPFGLAEAQPPDGLRDRLLRRIEQSDPSFKVVRRSEGKWTDTPFPGVSFKTLHFDPETAMFTSLLRLLPGASYPAHRHTAAEECLVLEGDARLDDIVLGPGDYNRNEAFTKHRRVSSEGGCLLLIIASSRDELLA